MANGVLKAESVGATSRVLLAVNQIGRPVIVAYAMTIGLVVAALLAGALLISVVSKSLGASDAVSDADAIVQMGRLETQHAALTAECHSLVSDAKTLCVVGARLYGERMQGVASRNGRLMTGPAVSARSAQFTNLAVVERVALRPEGVSFQPPTRP